MTLAPTAAAASMVEGLSPPSTWMSTSLDAALTTAHLPTTSCMNFWPPKPGSTVRTSTMSSLGKNRSTHSAGVFGLIAIPTFMPLSLMRSIRESTSLAWSSLDPSSIFSRGVEGRGWGWSGRQNATTKNGRRRAFNAPGTPNGRSRGSPRPSRSPGPTAWGSTPSGGSPRRRPEGSSSGT